MWECARLCVFPCGNMWMAYHHVSDRCGTPETNCHRGLPLCQRHSWTPRAIPQLLLCEQGRGWAFARGGRFKGAPVSGALRQPLPPTTLLGSRPPIAVDQSIHQASVAHGARGSRSITVSTNKLGGRTSRAVARWPTWRALRARGLRSGRGDLCFLIRCSPHGIQEAFLMKGVSAARHNRVAPAFDILAAKLARYVDKAHVSQHRVDVRGVARQVHAIEFTRHTHGFRGGCAHRRPSSMAA